MTSPPDPMSGFTTQSLAERLDVAVWDLEVVGAEMVSASIRRLRFAGDGVSELAFQAGQDLMVTVPAGEGREVRRRYTLRESDPTHGTVALDFVLHGDGPAARWAAAATVGDRLEAIGPRGAIVPRDDVGWHLFAGDESFVPAALEMIAALPAGTEAIALLEVDGPADHQPVSGAAEVDLRWSDRGGAAAGFPDTLLTALSSVELPAGTGHAYLGGELTVVATVRRHLLERGMAAEQISPKPYWRRGQANATHGEPARDRGSD